MGKWILFVWVCFSILSCSKKPKYEGFSVTNSGLNYKIHSLGDEIETLNDSDFVSITYSRFSNYGELLEGPTTEHFFNYRKGTSDQLMAFLGLLSLGDSASFVKKNNGVDQLVSCKLHLRVAPNVVKLLNEIPNFESHIPKSEVLGVLESLNGFENDSIQYVGGMFMIHQIQGSGKFPIKGDEVKFHMNSWSVNGVVFESTYKVNQPFTFVLGDQDQVIEGLNYGIRRMKKGGKATFVLPSPLAYGSSGSSTGLIPPFTTMIYQVELMDVKSN